MGSLITTASTAKNREKIEVNVEELVLRLRSLANGCTMEVVQLAVLSMLDEIEDAVGINKER